MRRRDLLLVALAASVFAWLAVEVAREGAVWFDAPVRNAVQGLGTPALTMIMREVTLLGWDFVVIPLALAIGWRLAAAGRRREAAILVVTVIGVDALVNLLKRGFHRPRPEALPGYPLPPSASFPSGHAALSVAFYGTLAGSLRALVLALILIPLIGLSRVYLGVHYPSDVLAGYAVGVLWSAAVRYGLSPESRAALGSASFRTASMRGVVRDSAGYSARGEGIEEVR